MNSQYKVGFIGLGRMGTHLAHHCHKQAPAAVWNRSLEKAKLHSEQHGTKFLEKVDSFRCPVVLCCLPTSQEVSLIAQQLIEARKQAHIEGGVGVQVFVDCTSGSQRHTVQLGRKLKEHGIAMVDCPVSGGPAGALAGTLAAMLGGEIWAVKKALPFISRFASKIEYVGQLGSGHAVKSINNLLNSAHLLTGTEGLIALKKLGIDPRKALKCINASSGRSLQTIQRIPQEVCEGRFEYGFDLQLMKKDCGLARELIEGLDICETESPSTLLRAEKQIAAIADHYGSTREGVTDYSYLAKYLEEQSGIDLRDEKVKV